jgi:hypothetical protein
MRKVDLMQLTDVDPPSGSLNTATPRPFVAVRAPACGANVKTARVNMKNKCQCFAILSIKAT